MADGGFTDAITRAVANAVSTAAMQVSIMMPTLSKHNITTVFIPLVGSTITYDAGFCWYSSADVANMVQLCQ